MRAKGKGPAWLAAIAVVLVFHAVLPYGLSGRMVLILCVLFAVLVCFIGATNAVTMATSFVLATLLVAIVIELAGLDRAIYYRPHERFSVFDYKNRYWRYKENVNVQMDGVHGDLQSMTDRKIAFPRSVVFRTDDRGFRNNRGLQNQRYLLVGDSFIVGNGSSQEGILTEQLGRDYGIDSYCLAHAGGIIEYEKYVNSIPRRTGVDRDVLLFMFEGNDFPEVLNQADDPNSLLLRAKNRLGQYIHIFRGTGIYRVSRSLRARLAHGRAISESVDVLIRQTAGRELAFYMPYVQVTERKDPVSVPELEAALKRLSNRIKAVFFIPTKCRVYATACHPGARLPNSQWEYLKEICANEGLWCINLTAPLALRSAELLNEGRFTFWPDDTHWNPDGMAVAAEQVHVALSATLE